MRIKVLILAASVVATAPVEAQRASSPEQEAVRGVLEAYASMIQAKNLSGIDSLWADGRGVHIIEGAGVNHGWADYRDNHLGRELAEFENLTYRYHAIEPVVRGNVAWSAFRYDLAVDTPNGHLEMEGRGTAVFEKREGQWVFVHLHTSGRQKD